MTNWSGKWIWAPGERKPVNSRVCFRKPFVLGDVLPETAEIRISADTKYRLWINGREFGEGPIRSNLNAWYFDTHDVAAALKRGLNAIAVQVWHYGHSNYQYIEAEAGLLVQLDYRTGEAEASIGTDAGWKYCVHRGFITDTVKRNVNLGWMEFYDAARWDGNWTEPDFPDGEWLSCVELGDGGDKPWGPLLPRDIPYMSTQTVFPARIAAISEVKPTAQTVSLNMRDNFFPETRDANAKIFSGMVATVFRVDRDVSGTISFAHSRWNGVQGRFRLNGDWYAANDPIRLPAGDHFFLMEICGVHNDVFMHMELRFGHSIQFVHPFTGREATEAQAAFVTAGPFESIEPVADGRQPVYGGVEKSNGLNERHPSLVKFGECRRSEELAAYEADCRHVSPRCVFLNHHIYSLMVHKEILQRYPVSRQEENALFSHPEPALIRPSERGGDLEWILDFGKIYVGRLEFELEAPAGTTIDFYGFEHMQDGSVKFTSGCNNSFRYTCQDGRQTYRSETRMGLRYLMLTVRTPKVPVRLFNVRLLQTSYPASGRTAFRCSDPLLNDIWEISRHTSHMCMEDTFVDCPTYEQVFWVGDCRVSALVNYSLFGSYELVRHSLRLVPHSREQSSLLLALTPTDWQAAIPMWTFSWLMACQEYVRYSGDTSINEEIYPEIRRTLDTYLSFVSEDGLLDTRSWNLLDWAPIDLPSAGIVTAQQAMLAQCCRMAAEMAEEMGLVEEGGRFRKSSEELNTALERHLWDEASDAYLDGIHRGGRKSSTRSLQTHILLYLTDCIGDEDKKARIVERLTSPPPDWVPVGTPFFSFYWFEALYRLGRFDLILERIRSDWGTMIRHGSTTCWETFQALPRSMAHAWSTAPAYFLGLYALGIHLLEDGFRRVRITPPDVAGLEWAEGVVPTPFGLLEVSWSRERELERPVLRIVVPRAIAVELDSDIRRDWELTVDTLG